MNSAARYVAGHQKADKVEVKQLLSEVGMPTFDALITRSVALETWKAINSGSPLGSLLVTGSGRSRSSARLAGRLAPPTRIRVDSFLWHSHSLWNSAPLLRSAPTIRLAKKVAIDMAK